MINKLMMFRHMREITPIAYSLSCRDRPALSCGEEVGARGIIAQVISCMLLIILATIASYAWAEESNSLDCVIEPHDVVEISSPVQGILEVVNVERGDTVKKPGGR